LVYIVYRHKKQSQKEMYLNLAKKNYENLLGYLRSAEKLASAQTCPRKPARTFYQGLKTLSFNSLMGLKCFLLLETIVMLFSAAVAAMMASPARSPCESAYASIYIKAR
jgi:hypothetical protein